MMTSGYQEGIAQVESPAGQGLTIVMTPPGHWHFTYTKELVFTVTDAAGQPALGLSPQVTVRTLSGRVDPLSAIDEGDGIYTVKYTAREIGPDYATGYAVAFTVDYQGEWYTEAWPVEVVRDGRETFSKRTAGTCTRCVTVGLQGNRSPTRICP
ncbi:MAG: hypothetical protein NTZ05_22770 [Chloroflexi bacterium]|nr:hypothetical protein [Chloroflexota bacterium]